jgi:5-methylcytosine-specific restriction endonuclease McrA
MDHRIEGGEYLNKKEAKLRFRQSILSDWDNRCAYCGDHLKRNATLDHVHPKMKGGLTHQWNLVACCFACNIGKSSEDWLEWYRRQPFWTPEREDQIIFWITGGLVA